MHPVARRGYKRGTRISYGHQPKLRDEIVARLVLQSEQKELERLKHELATESN